MLTATASNSTLVDSKELEELGKKCDDGKIVNIIYKGKKAKKKFCQIGKEPVEFIIKSCTCTRRQDNSGNFFFILMY